MAPGADFVGRYHKQLVGNAGIHISLLDEPVKQTKGYLTGRKIKTRLVEGFAEKEERQE